MQLLSWFGAAAAILLAVASPALADAPLLHPMFQDHAVLQRDKPIHVYGQAAADAVVTISLGAASANARADATGHWSVTLPAMEAGGPYTLSARSDAGAQQQVRDVLVGDVFLCTGQSNMQLTVRRAGNAAAETQAATDDQIRQLTVGLNASLKPLDSFAAPVQWVVESPATAGDFSASCFFFARELRKTVKVPIGLVVSAWGGTRVRNWVSEPTLRVLGYFNDDLDMLDLYKSDPQAAQRRWDVSWENWWRGHAKDEPWKVVYSRDQWGTAPPGLGAWVSWPGLSLPYGATEPGVGFVGQMWLATRVILTADQAAQVTSLSLGRATEEDETWINGHGVGGASGQPDSQHAIAPGALQAGENSIVTNIFCSWRNCGLSGPPASRALHLRNGAEVVLDQPWRYQPVQNLIAPQLPWGPTHGLTMDYNGMIAPIGPYTVKGAIWYQGESNIYFANHYRTTLLAMMADWRRLFGADLPFLIVQIPNYGPTPTKPVESGWSEVREAQRQAAADDAHSALVVTIDIGDPKLLHPTNKQEVGRRLAIAARHAIYGESIAPSGPLPFHANRGKDGIRIVFTDVTGMLLSYNGAPNAFELCGMGPNTCSYAPARVAGTSVVLKNDRNAKRVRYCWGDSPICTLSDSSGLAATPFQLPIR